MALDFNAIYKAYPNVVRVKNGEIGYDAKGGEINLDKSKIAAARNELNQEIKLPQSYPNFASITGEFVGILNDGDLIEAVKSYLNIINNEQYSLELEGGNIDIELSENNYIYKLEQLKFTGNVPATNNTDEIKTEFKVNGNLKLSGKNPETNVYNNLSADLDINSQLKFQDEIITDNTQISSEELYLDLVGKFEVTDDSLGRPTIKSHLDDIQILGP